MIKKLCFQVLFHILKPAMMAPPSLMATWSQVTKTAPILSCNNTSDISNYSKSLCSLISQFLIKTTLPPPPYSLELRSISVLQLTSKSRLLCYNSLANQSFTYSAMLFSWTLHPTLPINFSTIEFGDKGKLMGFTVKLLSVQLLFN